MHRKTITQLHIPLSLDPNRSFAITGYIQDIDRGLKKTTLSVKTIDLCRENDNEDHFALVMRDQIKSHYDKILEKGDFILSQGVLNSLSASGMPELEIKGLTAFDGIRNVFDTTRIVSVPLENIINPDSAY